MNRVYKLVMQVHGRRTIGFIPEAVLLLDAFVSSRRAPVAFVTSVRVISLFFTSNVPALLPLYGFQ